MNIWFKEIIINLNLLFNITFWFSLLMVIFLPSEKAMNHMF